MNKTTDYTECPSGEHIWENDPMFEDGGVVMITSMNGEEMRQYCTKCHKVRYVSK